MVPEQNISCRLLSDSDFDALYRAFIEAFSDYQANMNVSQDRFRERLVRDGVQMQLSAAAFANDEIVGFYINGIGQWKARATAYDAGTAVLPKYRARGITTRLFEFLLPHLEMRGVEQYLLEVITTNTPAVNLYQKLGFTKTRTLAVFRATEPLLPRSAPATVELQDVQQPDWPLYQSFWDAQPSWQNSIEAVKRIPSAVQIIAAFVERECVGYGILHRSTGNLMQLAVSPAHRRKHVGSSIVSALQNRLNSGEQLKATNIDRMSQAAVAFYQTSGFSHVLDQYEMIRSM